MQKRSEEYYYIVLSNEQDDVIQPSDKVIKLVGKRPHPHALKEIHRQNTKYKYMRLYLGPINLNTKYIPVKDSKRVNMLILARGY